MNLSINKFQKIHKIKFRNTSLLVKALTHKSANKNYNTIQIPVLLSPEPETFKKDLKTAKYKQTT